MTTSPVDRIEDFLESWGHKRWGFVIYRCAYASDADFHVLIENMKAEAAESLEIYSSKKVIENRERLDGARKYNVRQIFDEWCRSPEAAAEQPNSKHLIAESRHARYSFCVHVDQAAVDSVKTAPEPWVNLVMRRWPFTPQDDDDEDDEDEDEDDELDEIEGSKAEDVGWCKVKNLGLMPAAYSQLCSSNAWYIFYQRPPTMM